MQRRFLAQCVMALVAGCAVAGVLEVVEAGCAQTCEQISCGYPGNLTPPYSCYRFNPARCFSDTIYRDPPGGNCISVLTDSTVQKCPDCNPECPAQPTEATNCSMPASTGCVACCTNYLTFTDSWICRVSTH